MTLTLKVPQQDDLKPRITVFGVGGAGGNAVNNMIEKQLEGVEFVVANTDAQALQQSRAPNTIQMGVKVTEGLGAGARPQIGAKAAEESIEQIVDHLAGAHMCFITAGMGGGTGTGAAPIIAQAARELGVLTVGVVTKPFQFEGAKRMRQAEEGVEALQKMVDTLIIIPNQNLFRLANEKTTFTEAFSMADDVLYQGVKGVTDLMVRPGLINLDFADVRSVMDEMGKAMMGTGEAEGEERATQAAEKAIANPLLDEVSLKGARGVLINITGGYDLTLFELDEAANRIRKEVDPEANIIVGSTLDAEMEGVMRVSVVATGIDMTDNSAQEVRALPSAAAAPAITAGNAPAALPPGEPEEDESEPCPGGVSAGEGISQEAQQPAAAADDDGLPPPAYRPAGESGAAAGENAADFVAPRPPAPGTPSPEALERLQKAVRNASGQKGAPPRSEGGTAGQAASEQRSSRFGINSLIGRMTGQQAEPPRQQPAARRQPPVSGEAETPAATAPDADRERVDQERVEIPAFLRRQAN